MPITIEGHGIVYTQEEVNSGFVSMDKVRAEYVPKEGKEGFKARMKAKDAQIAQLNNTLLEAQPKLTQFDTMESELSTLRAEVSSGLDREAFRSAGLQPGEDGAFDSGLVDMIRFRHKSVLEGLPEDQREGVDAVEHFRSWVTSEEGLKADPFLGGHLKPAQATPEAVPSKTPAAKPTPSPTPRPVATPSATPEPGGKWTSETVHAFMGSPQYQNMPREQRLSWIAEREGELAVNAG